MSGYRSSLRPLPAADAILVVRPAGSLQSRGTAPCCGGPVTGAPPRLTAACRRIAAAVGSGTPGGSAPRCDRSVATRDGVTVGLGRRELDAGNSLRSRHLRRAFQLPSFRRRVSGRPTRCVFGRLAFGRRFRGCRPVWAERHGEADPRWRALRGRETVFRPVGGLSALAGVAHGGVRHRGLAAPVQRRHPAMILRHAGDAGWSSLQPGSRISNDGAEDIRVAGVCPGGHVAVGTAPTMTLSS